MPDKIQGVCTGTALDYDSAVDETSKTTVRFGESNLSDVARSRGLDPNALLAENPSIASLYAPINVGQEINLPVCQMPIAENPPDTSAPAQPPSGDPLAKSVVQADLKNKSELPGDEAAVKAAFGDEGLRQYRQTKNETIAEFKQARETYLQTGKVPPLKHHAPIEITAGVPMSRAQRYDLNLIHQGKSPDYANYDAQVDPAYLTRDEFTEEWKTRGEREMQACDDDNIRPGTKEQCRIDVKERYMGKAYMDASYAATRAAWNEGAYIESIKNSGPIGLGGRALGRGIGYAIAGEKGANKGEEIGAVAGGLGDVAVAVKSGANARARLNAYEGTGGLELGRDVPVEVTSSAPPPATTETQPDPPSAPKAPAENPDEPLALSHGTDNPGLQNMGGLGPGRIRVDHSPGDRQDFGQGFYVAVGKDTGVGNAEAFGDLRVQQRGTAPRQVLAWDVKRSDLGDVVDVRTGSQQAEAWNKFLNQPLAPNVKMTIGDYIRTTGVEHRGEYFEKFLQSIGKQNADVVIGPIGTPETAGVAKEPGTQMVIRSQRVADHLNNIMAGKPDPAPASGDGQGSAWRTGSGTSVHDPKPVNNPPAAPIFSEGEEEVIKSYMRSGKTRAQAEQIVKDSRGPENKITVVRPDSPNSSGTTRGPSWKNPGSGKKTP